MTKTTLFVPSAEQLLKELKEQGRKKFVKHYSGIPFIIGSSESVRFIEKQVEENKMEGC